MDLEWISIRKRPGVNLIFIILVPDGMRSMFVFHIPESIFPITSKPRRIMSPIRMIFLLKKILKEINIKRDSAQYYETRF